MGVKEEDAGDEHDPSNEVPFDDKPSESVPSASDHLAAPSSTTTTLPATHPAASSPTTTPPMGESLGFIGMPYPTYGVNPVATAPPMATTGRESVASSSTYTSINEPMPLRCAQGYHRPPAGVAQPIFLAMQHLSLAMPCQSLALPL